MIGAVKLMTDSTDLRPALAYLKAVASEDQEAIQVLVAHGDTLELVEGLADLLLLFIEDLADDPAEHIGRMFTAYQMAQRGIQ
jgi:hypothetical protein